MRILAFVLVILSISNLVSVYDIRQINERVSILEATIEKPELIHTCNLRDNKDRKVCGWVEVE